MFTLQEVFKQGQDIIGKCSVELFLQWSTDVVQMISSKIDTEPFKGTLDICTRGCSSCNSGKPCDRGLGCGKKCVTLPREVGTVLAVNIGGQPTLGMANLFSFHLNGPGDCRQSCEWAWQDMGANFPTYRDLGIPAKVVAYLQTPEDNGKKLIIYGYDSAGNVLRRTEGGITIDGYLVPTIYGVAVPDDTAPLIARITGVSKEVSVGSIRLATINSSGATGVNLATYEPDETLPQYRRIQLNRSCNWVRVTYLKSNKKFTSMFDHVPMLSQLAFLIGMSARKNYATYQLAEAHAFEADAARLELESQMKLEAPLYFPVQIIDRSNPRDKFDYSIV